MKRLILLLCALSAAACGRYGAGVPDRYEALLDDAMARTSRPEALLALLDTTPRDEREALAYLIAYMPQGDLDTMDLALLRENVTCACHARRTFPWTKELPDSIFLNEVLPYAAVDEVRDSWRPDFVARFTPRVAQCTDMRSAIEAVNRCISAEVEVEYNTLREKTNQSPAESMRQHMASCTGLSVLLVDALRAVGIPARFAGTPSWSDDRGNHSWTEVWIDGTWHFAEYYPAELDRSWFLADAGRAKPGDPRYGIFAVSFRPTGSHFPMVWSEESTAVHGCDVTQRYIDVCRDYTDAMVSRGTHTRVGFRMFRDAAHTAGSGDRVAANVDVFRGTEQVGGGRTASPLQDMNDVLTFLLEKGRTYTFRYENARGEAVALDVAVGDEPTVVTGYME